MVHASLRKLLASSAVARPSLRPSPLPLSPLRTTTRFRFAHSDAAATYAAYTTVPKSRSGRTRTMRSLAYLFAAAGTVWAVDRWANARALSRTLNTLWTCLAVSVDYKLNFTPAPGDDERIPRLQQRVADRIFDLLTSNGGLYIKIGQAIGNNAALLPAPLQEKFARLFDDAPQVPYSVVRRVIEAEFGRPVAGPDGVFELFEEQAAASASVAQVHRAKLRDPTGQGKGEWVAVKVQKPDVGKQVEWDLGAYRLVMRLYQWAFDLPVYFVADFICDQLRKELDFEQEARNAKETSAFIAAEKRLADKVYVPRVYEEFSTKRVMTAEWIDGVRLSDRKAIRKLMGEEAGASSTEPLRGGTKWIMQTMVELFSAQIFDWGFLHCDPHPGNVLVRPNPVSPRQPQFVLLDHGLYIRLEDTFRLQYSRLWAALLQGDFATVRTLTKAWGFGAPDLFASATLMKPIRLRTVKAKQGSPRQMTQYERGVFMKRKLREFLEDTDKVPKEIVFVGRNVRIVQGNNQQYGSPVNRIKITGNWAASALVASPASLTERLRAYWHYTVFHAVMLSLDIAFWTSRLRQWWRGGLGGGFEDDLERNVRGFAKASFGVELREEAFQG